jgi:hypothetical protein
MNFNVNKFKMPYTVPNKGRGLQTTFQYSPAWQQDIAPKMWNKVKNGAKFLLLWSPANSAKSHFALTFNEALPYTGYTVIVSHTTNIRNQHKKLIEHYYNTGYICKQVKSITIHQLYNWVKKLKNGYDITDKDKDILLSIDFLAIDELHKYSKGKSTKMLTTVADYLFQHGKLRLIVGTTMTGKYVNTIWQWAGTYVTRAKYTFWPDPKLLAKDGMSYPNNSEYLHCDKKTKVFDKQYTDSLGKRADDPFFDQYCSVLLNSDEDNAVDNLINEDHELKFRTDKKIRIECLAYLDCRVKCAIDHWIKFYLGQPAIINVPGVKNAEYYSKYFRKRLQSLGYDAIHWNGLSKNSHSTYKNDERSMLDDLCDLKKQLKITFTNGMLREGTNEEINKYPIRTKRKNHGDYVGRYEYK